MNDLNLGTNLTSHERRKVMAQEKILEKSKKTFTLGLILGVVAMMIFYHFYPKDVFGGAPLVAFAALLCGIVVFLFVTAAIILARRQGVPIEDFFKELRWLCGLREKGIEYQTGEMMNMNLRLSATVFVVGIIFMYFLRAEVTAWTRGTIPSSYPQSMIVILPSALVACFTFMGACVRKFKLT